MQSNLVRLFLMSFAQIVNELFKNLPIYDYA